MLLFLLVAAVDVRYCSHIYSQEPIDIHSGPSLVKSEGEMYRLGWMCPSVGVELTSRFQLNLHLAT